MVEILLIYGIAGEYYYNARKSFIIQNLNEWRGTLLWEKSRFIAASEFGGKSLTIKLAATYATYVNIQHATTYHFCTLLLYLEYHNE